MLSVVPRVKMTSSSAAALRKCLHSSSRRLVAVRGFFAQRVNAAVHVGVVTLVDVDHRLDDLPRMLGGGAVVEINQRHARPIVALVQQCGQYGKIGTQSRNVNRSGDCSESWLDLFFCRLVGGIERSVQRRLRGSPGQQAALLPIGSQPRAEQFEHVLGRKAFELLDLAAANALDQH